MIIKPHHLIDPVMPDQIEAAIILPILAQASILEANFSNLLIPPKLGLYAPGKVDPTFTPSGEYYVKTPMQGWRRVENSELFSFNIVDAIYNASGEMLANYQMMKEAKRVFSTSPTIPVRGIALTRAVIDNKLMSWCPWAKTGYTVRTILTQFRPNITPETIVDDIEVLLMDTLGRLGNFVGDDVWNYYFVKFTGYDIIVEKGKDSRLCEWYEKKMSGEW
jgi:hypothetical protein